MTIADYTSYDAIGLAELVHSQKVTPLELVETAIELIQKHNPALNAVIWTMFDRARDTADRRRLCGRPVPAQRHIGRYGGSTDARRITAQSWRSCPP